MPARNHRTMSGFTMVELMVVVLVLSLLIGWGWHAAAEPG